MSTVPSDHWLFNPQPKGDEQIVALFAEWVLHRRSAPLDDSDAAGDVWSDRGRDLEEAIAALPAVSIVGFAIKVHLLIVWDRDALVDDPASATPAPWWAVNPPEDPPDDDSGSMFVGNSLLADIRRLVPEIERILATARP